MPLYMCQPPTGYKDTGDAWVNTGALIGRMNLALRLAGNQLHGTSVDSSQSAIPTPQSAVDSFLSGSASDTTRATIAKATTASQMAALTLGAPEFQRR
jgi:uncharacterized protein (DUF1800 family)